MSIEGTREVFLEQNICFESTVFYEQMIHSLFKQVNAVGSQPIKTIIYGWYITMTSVVNASSNNKW